MTRKQAEIAKELLAQITEIETKIYDLENTPELWIQGKRKHSQGDSCLYKDIKIVLEEPMMNTVVKVALNFLNIEKKELLKKVKGIK